MNEFHEIQTQFPKTISKQLPKSAVNASQIPPQKKREYI